MVRLSYTSLPLGSHPSPFGIIKPPKKKTDLLKFTSATLRSERANFSWLTPWVTGLP